MKLLASFKIIYRNFSSSPLSPKFLSSSSERWLSPQALVLYIDFHPQSLRHELVRAQISGTLSLSMFYEALKFFTTNIRLCLVVHVCKTHFEELLRATCEDNNNLPGVSKEGREILKLSAACVIVS